MCIQEGTLEPLSGLKTNHKAKPKVSEVHKFND